MENAKMPAFSARTKFLRESLKLFLAVWVARKYHRNGKGKRRKRICVEFYKSRPLLNDQRGIFSGAR